MDKEQIQEISCMVIANAGDAFDQFKQAVGLAGDGDFAGAEELMKKGEDALIEAHSSQTALLTAEMRGQDLPFSLLLVHAQDHLMHAITYQQIAKDTIKLYQKLRRADAE